MKVYMTYLVISDDDFKDLNINIILDRGRFRKTDSGMYVSLYAFTNDKSIFKSFANDRNLGKNRYLIKRTVKMDDTTYAILRSDHGYAELGMVKLRCSHNMVTWLSLTKDEKYNVTHGNREIISEFLMDVVLIDYKVFDYEIQDLLEIIFYNYYRDIFYGSDSDIDERLYNTSYGIDPDSLWGSQLGLFLYLYKNLISLEHIWENINKQMEKRGDLDEDD